MSRNWKSSTDTSAPANRSAFHTENNLTTGNCTLKWHEIEYRRRDYVINGYLYRQLGQVLF